MKVKRPWWKQRISVGNIIKKMWEGQLVDPQINYITSVIATPYYFWRTSKPWTLLLILNSSTTLFFQFNFYFYILKLRQWVFTYSFGTYKLRLIRHENCLYIQPYSLHTLVTHIQWDHSFLFRSLPSCILKWDLNHRRSKDSYMNLLFINPLSHHGIFIFLDLPKTFLRKK